MEYISHFLEQIDFADNLIYRGHSDRHWVLRPSVGRFYEGCWDNVVEWETQALVEFKNRYPTLNTDQRQI